MILRSVFGRVLIIKFLGLSQLVYSASNLTVPQEITPIIKTKLFNFLWKNRRDNIKRAGLYQDRGEGGIRMTDVQTMIKALHEASLGPNTFDSRTEEIGKLITKKSSSKETGPVFIRE